MAANGLVKAEDRGEANRDILANAYQVLAELDMRGVPKVMRPDVAALRLQAAALSVQLDKYLDGPLTLPSPARSPSSPVRARRHT